MCVDDTEFFLFYYNEAFIVMKLTSIACHAINAITFVLIEKIRIKIMAGNKEKK